MNFHIKPFHTLFKKRTEGFRFSEAICEKAIYTAEFKKYQPLQLDGDPAVAEYLPNNQANTVCNQLLNQAEERGNNARSLLNAYGLEPGNDPKEYWRQVEQWLPSLCEQSQEPEHLKLDVARRPLLTPNGTSVFI